MNLHHRRSIRLPGYDYASEGSYFVTLVTHGRVPLFGEIIDEEMVLNDFGMIVHEEWLKTAQLRSEVVLVEDEFVIMPNHFHGIVNIVDTDENDGKGDRPVSPTMRRSSPTKPNGPKPKSLGALIAGFKSAVTTRINTSRNTPGTPIWQRNYYEHIIGTDREYESIAAYIANNPSNWNADKDNVL